MTARDFTARPRVLVGADSKRPELPTHMFVGSQRPQVPAHGLQRTPDAVGPYELREGESAGADFVSHGPSMDNPAHEFEHGWRGFSTSSPELHGSKKGKQRLNEMKRSFVDDSAGPEKKARTANGCRSHDADSPRRGATSGNVEASYPASRPRIDNSMSGNGQVQDTTLEGRVVGGSSRERLRMKAEPSERDLDAAVNGLSLASTGSC